MAGFFLFPRYWYLIKLAKRCKMSVSQLIKTYDEAFQSQPTFEGIDVQNLLTQTPERFDWLIAGLMPMASTALLYAEAGTGKTLLTNSLIKAVATGENWIVARQDENGMLRLRKSGLAKIHHKVHVSKVEIGSYRQ